MAPYQEHTAKHRQQLGRFFPIRICLKLTLTADASEHAWLKYRPCK